MNQDNPSFVTLTNGESLPLDQIPILSFDSFRQSLLAGVAAGQRVSALFADPTQQPDLTRLYVVMADDEQNQLYAALTHIQRRSLSRSDAGLPAASSV